jgi:hypothetical protein
MTTDRRNPAVWSFAYASYRTYYALGGIASAALTLTVLGCTRYEWVSDYETPACVGYQGRPTSHIILSGPTAVTEPSVIRGRVIDDEHQTPMDHATVVIRGTTVHGMNTDSTGTFRFDAVAPGQYLMQVRRLAYVPASDSILVPLAGRDVEVRLGASMLDGPCSGFASVRMRKPWWKIW